MSPIPALGSSIRVRPDELTNGTEFCVAAFCGGAADGGEEFEFTDGDGDVVFIGFETEGTGHAAASGSGSLEVDTEAAENGFFGVHLHKRFLMAVAVEKGFAVEFANREVRGVGFEEFAEEQSLAG